MKIATLKNFGAFMSANAGSPKKTPPRDIEYFEIEFLSSGKGTLTLDNKTYTVNDNSISIKKPNQKGFSCFSIKCFFLYLEVEKSSEYYDLLMGLPSFYPCIDPLIYSKIFKDIIKHITSTNSTEDDYITSKLLELFYHLNVDKQKNI